MSMRSELVTIADIVRGQAKAQPDKKAFVFEGTTISYGELDKAASQCAHGLRALGIEHGERIAYLGKNTPHYFELLMGAAKLGAVVCPINWRIAPPEAAYILNDAKARVLFVGAEFVAALDPIRLNAPCIEHVICLEQNAAGLPDYLHWRCGHATDDPKLAVASDEDAVQLYTSGTTGYPKGAVISHAALLESNFRGQERDNPEWNRWCAEDVSLIAMPCFHIGGTAWGLTTLSFGATGVVMREFDPLKVLDFIDEHRISKLFLVPAAMQIVVNQPRVAEVDFSPLKYILYGASPIPLALLQRSIEVFQCGFVQMYGMTETSGTIVALPPEDHDPAGNPRMRSAGQALPGVEIMILDDAGHARPQGEVGEIATRSRMNMTKYWNQPDATAATIDAEGWLRTGDAGYLDEDGYLFIRDRVKDMIISGGENVYPAEVENAVFDHPAVADVAVIGVPDDTWGEAVKACVVLKADAVASEADLIKYARGKIAAYKCPKSVDFVDTLPRNPSGKVLRRELRSQYSKAS